ncbi:MAG: hypothetical protein IRY99_08765 [Isosphaeraceae bacterium]|nr:hypothetical protein [Isosphaeraceae bacterium]
MAHETEAACLLRSGALYAQRLGLRSASGSLIFAGRKRGAFSLYCDDEPIIHFDLEGRWQRAFLGGVHYLKALDGTVAAIDRVREGPSLVLHRRALDFAATSDLDASIRSLALDLIERLNSGHLAVIPPPEPAQPITTEDLLDLLERVSRWDAAAWFAQREKYLDTYGPLPFLPPEAQQSVLLQATLGHARGLAFGGAVPAEFYARTGPEFEQHARIVTGLLGRRILQCNAVFLAGPDVLRQPLENVEAYLRTIAAVFPLDRGPAPQRPRDLPEDRPSLGGVVAFLDDFTPPRPDRGAWDRLRALGLRRVSLGIESGSPRVRALHGKAWGDESLRTLVSDLKEAGISARPVLLIGAGGRAFAEDHVKASADLLNSLPMDREDIVYLVDAAELVEPSTCDPETAPLTGPARAQQLSELKQRLAPLRNLRGAKVVPYSLEKQ